MCVAVCQRRTVLSREVVRRKEPSCVDFTERMVSLCPYSRLEEKVGMLNRRSS